MGSVLESLQPPPFLKLLAHELRWQLLTLLVRSDYRVQELVRLVGQPANLVSYHLKQLRAHHIVHERRSTADARDVYYTLDLDVVRQHYEAVGNAIHPLLHEPESPPNTQSATLTARQVRVLFLCTHNSARSQMAEGLLRSMSKGRVDVVSAGSQPTVVHSDAIATLAALQIDISQQRSKSLDELADQQFDYIITVCDQVREICPVSPNDPEQVHWGFADPAAIDDPTERRAAFVRTARELSTRISHLLLLIDRNSEGR